jgi:hypothetical protein
MRGIFIIIFLSLLITSCGKKNDPVYKENKTRLFESKPIVVS